MTLTIHIKEAVRMTREEFLAHIPPDVNRQDFINYMDKYEGPEAHDYLEMHLPKEEQINRNIAYSVHRDFINSLQKLS